MNYLKRTVNQVVTYNNKYKYILLSLIFSYFYKHESYRNCRYTYLPTYVYLDRYFRLRCAIFMQVLIFHYILLIS